MHVVSVNEAERRFLPLEMHGVANDETLWTWLTRRIVPKHRNYIQMMLGNLGLYHKDTRSIIEICKGLSLNDVYWVVADGFSGKWKDHNLYDNEFSKTLAVMAFTGGCRRNFEVGRDNSSSPEFTTNGMLAKCWRRRDGRGASSGIGLYRDRYGQMIAYGSEFRCILQVKRIKFVELRSQVEKPRVPLETRTPKRIYVLVGRNGRLKAVTFYDSKGRRRLQIDLDHSHSGHMPHRHTGYGHDNGTPLRPSEKRIVIIIEKIWRDYNGGK